MLKNKRCCFEFSLIYGGINPQQLKSTVLLIDSTHGQRLRGQKDQQNLRLQPQLQRTPPIYLDHRR